MHCLPSRWGDGYKKILVIAKHRGGGRYTNNITDSKHVGNWRYQAIYNPKVVRQLQKYAANNWESKEHVEDYLRFLRQR